MLSVGKEYFVMGQGTPFTHFNNQYTSFKTEICFKSLSFHHQPLKATGLPEKHLQVQRASYLKAKFSKENKTKKQGSASI